MNTLERLESLRNRPTRYEAVATHSDGRSVFMGYTSRRSKEGLFNLVSSRGEENLVLLSLPRDARMIAGKGQSILIGPWLVSFTGRTQRESIQWGELPR